MLLESSNKLSTAGNQRFQNVLQPREEDGAERGKSQLARLRYQQFRLQESQDGILEGNEREENHEEKKEKGNTEGRNTGAEYTRSSLQERIIFRIYSHF